MSMSMLIGMGQPQAVNLCSPSRFHTRTRTSTLSLTGTARRHKDLISLQQKFNSKGKFFCLFSPFNNHRKQEDARKALEGALGSKQNEFDKWNQEIKKREQLAAGGAGGNSGGGRGWLGWGRWFSGDDHFWQETQQTTLAVLAIILIYLVIAKGEVLLAVFFNPLLFALRGTRNAVTSLVSPPLATTPTAHSEIHTLPTTAKERVVKKWAGN